LTAAASALAAAPAAAQTAPEGLSSVDESWIAHQQILLDDLRSALADGEEALRQGYCDLRNSHVETAKAKLNSVSPPSQNTVEDDEVAALRTRVQALGAADCPPPEIREAREREWELILSIGDYDVPGPGNGFLDNGLEEEYVVSSPHMQRLIRATLEAPVTDEIYISGGFGTIAALGDNRNDAIVPAGGTSGIVYGAPAPSGSTGIATPFGISGEAESDLTIFGFGVGYDLSDAVSVFADYSHRDHDYDASISGSGTSGGFDFVFEQEREQSIDEDLYEVGLKAEHALRLADKFSLELSGAAGVYRRESELRSTEHNTANFGSPADQDFTTVIDEDDGGWGAHGQAGAAFSWNFTRAVAIKFGGSVDYRSNVATIFNPVSGDEVLAGLTTTLDTHHAWIWQAGVGIAVALGR
jgi:hypothetical protein